MLGDDDLETMETPEQMYPALHRFPDGDQSQCHFTTLETFRPPPDKEPWQMASGPARFPGYAGWLEYVDRDAMAFKFPCLRCETIGAILAICPFACGQDETTGFVVKRGAAQRREYGSFCRKRTRLRVKPGIVRHHIVRRERGTCPLPWSTVFDIVQAYRQRNPSLIDLSTGQALLIPEVARAIARVLATFESTPDHGMRFFGSYTNLRGYPELLHAFQERLSSLWCREVAKEELLVVPGASQALTYFQQCLRSVTPGHPSLPRGPFRISFPIGGYEFFGMGDDRSPFPAAIGPYCATPIGIGKMHVRLPRDLSQLEWDGVGAVALSRPHNPTGRMWTKEEIQRLAQAALAANAWLVLDEAESLPWAPLSRTPVPPVDGANIIHVFSFSKVGLATLRVGVVVAPPDIIAMLEPVMRRHIIQAPSLSQLAACAAIDLFKQAAPESWFGSLYAERWHLCESALQAAGALDAHRQVSEWEGGPCVWFTWSHGPTSQEVFYRLLEEAQVAVAPASALQMGTSSSIQGVRIGLGGEYALEEYERALARLAPVLARATECSMPSFPLPRHRQDAIKKILMRTSTP